MKINVSVSIEPKVWERAEQLSKLLGVSRSALVSLLLSEKCATYLDNQQFSSTTFSTFSNSAGEAKHE